MQWMIYTLGDAAFFAAVLNGVAMVFGSGFFRGDSGSFGGSAILMVFLLALMAVLVSALINQWRSGNNPTMLLVLFILWFAGGYARVNVVIEDVYTGNAQAVDNVPLIVGVPASLITTAAISIGELFQTAFGMVDATSGEMNTQGFMNPLKLILSVRHASSYSPHLVSNWTNFARHCIIGSSNPSALMSDPGGIIDALQNSDNHSPWRKTPVFANNLSATGDALLPTIMSCDEAGPHIAAELNDYFDSTNPALNKAVRDGLGRNMNVDDKTWDDIANFYGSSAALTGLDAQKTSANIMMYQATMDVFKCGNNSSDPTAYFACTQLLSDQQQAFAVDAAAAGAGFSRTVISSMGFLLALFFGVSPLVMLVALASGAQAFSLIGKYIMFGAWTQSWLPVAYIVNFFVMWTWTDAVEQLTSRFDDGIPLESLPLFWMETADKIAIASDLLAAVPLITLAVMTGSYFALAKLGDRWSNRDYANERMVAPQLASVGAVANSDSFRNFSVGAGGQLAGAMRQTFNFQDGMSQAVSDKQQEMLRVGSETSNDWSSTGRFASGWDRVTSTARTDAAQIGQTWANAISFTDKMAQTSAFSDKVSDGVRGEVSGQARASMAALLKGNGLQGVFAGNYSMLSQEAREWVTGTQEGKEWANQIRSEFSRQEYTSLQGSEQLAIKAGFTREEAGSIRESLSRQAATVQAYEEATQIASSVGSSLSGHAGQIHHALLPQYQSVMGMHAALYAGTDDASERYRESYDRIARAEANQGVTAADAQMGWVVGAMLGTGHHQQVMEIGRNVTGAAGLSTPNSGSYQGIAVPVHDRDGNPVEQVASRHGAAPPAPTVAGLNSPPPEVPVKPENTAPANPGGVRTFTREDGRRTMAGADEIMTNTGLGAAGYVVDATINTVAAPVRAAGDVYNEHIRPHAVPIQPAVDLIQDWAKENIPSLSDLNPFRNRTGDVPIGESTIPESGSWQPPASEPELWRQIPR